MAQPICLCCGKGFWFISNSWDGPIQKTYDIVCLTYDIVYDIVRHAWYIRYEPTISYVMYIRYRRSFRTYNIVYDMLKWQPTMAYVSDTMWYVHVRHRTYIWCRTYDVVRLYPVYCTDDIARTMYNTMSCVARTMSYVMHVRHRSYVRHRRWEESRWCIIWKLLRNMLTNMQNMHSMLSIQYAKYVNKYVKQNAYYVKKICKICIALGIARGIGRCNMQINRFNMHNMHNMYNMHNMQSDMYKNMQNNMSIICIICKIWQYLQYSKKYVK